MTFGQLYEQTVRYAQWMLEKGIKPGELVGMYLINSPDFMIIWFATLCIGAAPAFLNYNLEGKALLHCLEVCETSLIIVDEDPDCQRRIAGSQTDIEARGARIAVLDDALKTEILSRPAVCPEDKYRDGTPGSFPYTLIYTSGTTGLPKGCAFTQSRLRLLGSHLEPAFDGKPRESVWYNSMPLYHGTGAITSSTALLGGLGLAIGRKFSVSRFWDEIHDSEATFFIYVGETARYLLNAPPHPLERAHKLRLCYGNGLRPDVWSRIQSRFNIPEVGEFFNSSEGMFSTVVWDKGPFFAACVGHHGAILRRLLHNVYVPVAIDHETGDIWRDPATGLAKRVPYEEGGEMLVAVPNKAAFQGYWRNDAATDKKFAFDIIKKGDIWYRSGDALRRDRDGKWFFMDRLGDTFRWKSENVSTAEVAECLGKFPGVAEANVYGVLVPNHEGRAGCAALHLTHDIDFNALLQYTRERLPRYAVPVFLRVVKASTHIHNHKQNKVPLRKEGVDPKLVGTEVAEGKDDVFLWLPPKSDRYVPFGAADWAMLEAGGLKL
jgi:acyl-CoA synthetase (AMP-forming)/AMP-acid ligase II